MNTLRLILISLLLSLLLGACGDKEEAAAPEMAASPAAASLMAYVPADTPYLAANLQPIPDNVIDAQFERAQPVLEELQGQVTRIKTEWESGGEMPDDPMERLMIAWVDAYDGKINREGLESMGWDFQSSSVLYGVGAFPTLRVSSSDPRALSDSIMAILENADIEAPQAEFLGQPYWRIDADDTDEMPIALYIAVLSDHFALGLYPIATEAGFLPGFLGLEMPGDHYRAVSLAQLNQQHGYSAYGSGFVDFHRLADEFMDPEATTARVLASFDEYDLEDFSEQCVAETHRIIDNMPYLSGGVTEMGVDAVSYRAVFQHPSELARELTGLVAALPVARTLSDHLAELSFGIKVGAARDFLRGKAEHVQSDPFRCEHFADINQQAGDLLEKLNQPLPPFVNNFLGLRLSIKELDMEPGQTMPNDVRGHLAVHVEQPEMFLGMAQMFLPDLADMQLSPGSDPKPVPEFLMSVQGISAYAAMSDQAIGISVGEGEQETLGDFLAMPAGNDGTFLSVDYDTAAYYQLQELQMGEVEAIDPDDPMNSFYESLMEWAKAASEREHTEMKFTSKGLVIESRTTYE